MAEEYVLPQPETLSIEPRDADKLIAAGSGDAALVYLYIKRRNGRLDAEKARTELGLGERLDAALSTLQKLGLVRLPGGYAAARVQPAQLPPGSSSELPAYTVADVQRATDEVDGFKSLLDETAKLLGRVLSGNDLLVLYGLYDYLSLPPEVILVVVSWCAQEAERRFGPGRKPTLRQIEKEAYIWQERGILTLELAEEHVRELTGRREESWTVRRILGLANRDTSPSEDKYIRAWLEMGFTPEAIGEAYDRTILKKKELAWPYMNRILESWHKKEAHDLPAILEADPRERKTAGQQSTGSQKRSGPTAEELRRLQRFVDKMNGGGGDGA